MADDGMMSTAELEAEMHALESSLMAGLTEDLGVSEPVTNTDTAMHEAPESSPLTPLRDEDDINLFGVDPNLVQRAEIANDAELSVVNEVVVDNAATEFNKDDVPTAEDPDAVPAGQRRRRGKKITSGWDSDYEPDNEAPAAKSAGKGTARKTRKKAATVVADTSERTSVARDTPSAVAKKRTAKVPVPAGRVRRPPTNGIIDSRPLGRSLAECDPADQMLFTKASASVPWPEIHAAWKEMTGAEPAASTLPNRFKRLKENFSTINEEDRPFLLDAKEEIEKEWQAVKWTRIAERVKEKGGEGYQADVLQRTWKKLMVAEGLRPPPGLVDPDWQIEIDEGGVIDGGAGEAA